MKFSPHGEIFSAELVGDIVLVKAAGPWNAELYLEYMKAAYPLIIKANAQGCWATLTHIYHSVMAPPESFAAIRQSMLSDPGMSQNFAVCGFVFEPDISEGEFFRAPYIRTYEGICPCDVFIGTDEDQAIGWMQAIIADFRRQRGLPVPS